MGDEEKKPTLFHLEVDLSDVAGDPPEELARILRYWAGNIKHYEVDGAISEAVYDSQYREVGQWSLS